MTSLRNSLIFLFIIFISFSKAQNTYADLLSIPGPVEFDGTEYFLSWSKPISKTLVRQQYLPAEESLENFTEMLDFSFFNKEIEIEMAVRQRVEGIQYRAKSDKYAKVNVAESPDGKEFIVDYFTSENPEQGDSFIEYNIYRFKSPQIGTDKNFLILAHTKRVYGDLRSAAKSLAKERDHLLTAMIEFPIPDIKMVSIN